MATNLRSLLLAVCLALPFPVTDAWAAGGSSVSLSPVCLTRSNSTLFFMEQTSDCGGASRRCRGSRWAWALLKAGSWEFEALGDATLDDEAAPDTNLQSTRQLFKAPAAGACVSYFRVPRVREPDLADSDSWFAYSIERGALLLHWQDQKVAVPGEVRLSRAFWTREGPRVDSRGVDAGFSVLEAKSGTKTVVKLVPRVAFTLNAEVILGFSEPAQEGAKDQGFLVLQVPEARLRQLQAQLLHEDARRSMEKAGGDLLSESRAAGLLDASLQLAPANADARWDYARLLARQGMAAPAVRELEKLRTQAGLRARLDSEKAFLPIKETEPFRNLVDGLPK